MWKIVITEIQDANALDPANAPPGAFFVSVDRFVKTVDNLDLPTLIDFCQGQASSDEITLRQINRLIEPAQLPPFSDRSLVSCGVRGVFGDYLPVASA